MITFDDGVRHMEEKHRIEALPEPKRSWKWRILNFFGIYQMTEYDLDEALGELEGLERPDPETGMCPQCGLILDDNPDFCPRCDWRMPSPVDHFDEERPGRLESLENESGDLEHNREQIEGGTV